MITDSIQIDDELRAAIANDRLLVCYQPKINSQSGRVVGAEALVRWPHPDRGMLSPGAFLPQAAAANLLDDIGWYVLRHAMRDFALLAKAGTPLPVSFNVNSSMFEQGGFCDRLLGALKVAGLPPPLLELEFTERVALRDPDRVVRIVQPLRKLGVRFAIDDFGQGYSSLSYLSRLPVDTIKIDGPIIRAAGRGANTSAEMLVAAIVKVAESQGIAIVAEGVETAADFSFISRIGISSAQGYFFSKALPARGFGEFLARHEAGFSPPRAKGQLLH